LREQKKKEKEAKRNINFVFNSQIFKNQKRERTLKKKEKMLSKLTSSVARAQIAASKAQCSIDF